MDKKQIIHIASEVVVISGLAVYFKLKNNSLMKMIEELENKLETQQESINEFQTRFSTQEYELHRHELILSSLVAKVRESSARNMEEDDIEEYHYEPILPKRTKTQVGSRIQPQSESKKTEKRIQPQSESKKTEKRIETQGERKKTEKRIEPQVEKKIIHVPIVETADDESEEENLDEQILNELNELVQGSPARPKIEEEEIIEIDTSLKKKA
jgi:hypothetical protein